MVTRDEVLLIIFCSINCVSRAQCTAHESIIFYNNTKGSKRKSLYYFISFELIFYCYTKMKVQVSVMSDSLWPHGLYSSWNSPGQNTILQDKILEWVAFPFLQGIFRNWWLNSGLPHCRQVLYPLNHKGNPRMLEWEAYSFSSRSSQPRNWTGLSCIAGRLFTNWAIMEANIHKC